MLCGRVWAGGFGFGTDFGEGGDRLLCSLGGGCDCGFGVVSGQTEY